MNVYNMQEPEANSELNAHRALVATSSFARHDLFNIQFEQLKKRLAQNVLCCIEDPEMEHSLHVAISEAAALAWTTPYPSFVFPCLLEEKINEVCQLFTRQKQMNLRMRKSMAIAFKSGAIPWDATWIETKRKSQLQDNISNDL